MFATLLCSKKDYVLVIIALWSHLIISQLLYSFSSELKPRVQRPTHTSIMKIHHFALILAAPLLFSQSSCAVRSTVQSRIAEYPDFYAKLSTKHKTLVQQNRVTEGMNKRAAYLAWGSPAEVKKSSRNGRVTETWNYVKYDRIYTSRSYAGGYGGLGYGDYGGYGYSGDCYGGGTDITYLPKVVAKIEFRNDRITSWETSR